MKHKVSELEGVLLDAAVAKAEGFNYFYDEHCFKVSPSVDWEAGGPIIERELIAVMPYGNGWSANPRFLDEHEETEHIHTGPTPLVAAMRAYVASKFGEEMEL